jgi:SAM-dependent methyltransferase
MKTLIPWWFKILAKIILSRLPFGYKVWQRIGIFRHGYMEQGSYALHVFNEHVSRAGKQVMLQGKTILELGPGDSIATALVAASYGAKAILVDAGPFAMTDIEGYHKLAQDLEHAGVSPPDISTAETLDEILDACNAVYLTEGLHSFSSIEAGTIDLIYSQAVLEHVRKHEFQDTMRECFRVLTPAGIASHRVDLKDHLGGSLNNLRFSERIWESEFFVSSGFYTNRIRYPKMITICKQVGFDVEVCDVRRWDDLPLKKQSLSKEFSYYSNEELIVTGFDILLRK